MPSQGKVPSLSLLNRFVTARSQPASKSTAIALGEANSAEWAAIVWGVAIGRNNKFYKEAIHPKQLSFSDFIV